MLCTTQPYNENEDVRIEKFDCYDYVFHNKTPCHQTITIRKLTNGSESYEEIIELPSLGTANVTLPCDGIYSVKGQGGECLLLNVLNSETIVPLVVQLSIFDIGDPIVDLDINLVADTGQSIDIYDPALHGPSTISNTTNMINQLNAYGAASGYPYYLASFVGPGDPLTGYEHIYPDTGGYRLLVYYVGTKANRFTVGDINYDPVVNVCAYYAPAVIPVGYNYITSTLIDGTEQMGEYDYYDINDGDRYEEWKSLIAGALSNYGDVVDMPGPDEFGALEIQQGEECPHMEFVLSEGETYQYDIQWCTTFWEWCKLWNCAQEKIREWLCCNDPCDTTCPNPPTGADWIDQMMNLTMWGIQPLLTEHHLWQFGNMHDDQTGNLSRLQPTILLWDRWYKLVNGCGCEKVDLCSPCKDGNIAISTVTTYNPTNNKGGGCGCG